MVSTQPTFSIVMVPRESFSRTLSAIQSILEHTPRPFEFIVVEGGFPEYLRTRIDRLAEAEKLQIVRHPHFLYPNQARQYGLARCTSEYIVFADNDIEVHPNWIMPLLECAVTEGASAVAPLVWENVQNRVQIHMAAGKIHTDANRVLSTQSELYHLPHTDNSWRSLTRSPTQLFEYHCVLLNRQDCIDLSLFDLELMNTREHVDTCLTLTKHGRKIFFEPRSEITFHWPNPLHVIDKKYFDFRWDPETMTRSLLHFEKKWNCKVSPQHVSAMLDRSVELKEEAETNFFLKLSSWFRRAR